MISAKILTIAVKERLTSALGVDQIRLPIQHVSETAVNFSGFGFSVALMKIHSALADDGQLVAIRSLYNSNTRTSFAKNE